MCSNFSAISSQMRRCQTFPSSSVTQLEIFVLLDGQLDLAGVIDLSDLLSNLAIRYELSMAFLSKRYTGQDGPAAHFCCAT